MRKVIQITHDEFVTMSKETETLTIKAVESMPVGRIYLEKMGDDGRWVAMEVVGHSEGSPEFVQYPLQII